MCVGVAVTVTLLVVVSVALEWCNSMEDFSSSRYCGNSIHGKLVVFSHCHYTIDSYLVRIHAQQERWISFLFIIVTCACTVNTRMWLSVYLHCNHLASACMCTATRVCVCVGPCSPAFACWFSRRRSSLLFAGNVNIVAGLRPPRADCAGACVGAL